ncbi:hypothetical protein HY634_02840 [Candidatus Uhrbacteria bacterium]|nr:hypothetical protein [Candidatus Uhrbacteria bacterium]
MSGPIHAELAAGRWHTMSLVEQLGNIGSEVGRALRAHGAGNTERETRAFDRALELFDLTIGDPRRRGSQLREIARAREVVSDYLIGGNRYQSTPESLDRYFTQFAIAARR